MAQRRSARAGFTLLELVVVICLVGIFASVALDRLLRYQEIAEKAAMEATIGSMRSAQALQASARILQRGLPAVRELANENPVNWLATVPEGYLGALYDPGASEVPAGSWYFDLKNNELVYKPRNTRHFSPNAYGDSLVRFRVLVDVRTDSASGVGALSELTIRPTAPVRWTPEFG